MEFRRRWLKDAPRHLAVLELAAGGQAGEDRLPAGRARGIALHESFGSVVAQVAEVSLEQGQPRVHRVVCAIDCGTVVNPGIVAQQMEGAVRVRAHSGPPRPHRHPRRDACSRGTSPTTPMLTAASTPSVETWIVRSERPPGGVGEPGVPPIAPAVANALFALTGKRLRTLPLTGAVQA